MVSNHHPILVQIVPIRRRNLACTYCNQFDAMSKPVPLPVTLRRVDLLAGLGATIITISGGEPMLHLELDDIIRHIRRRGAIATVITNGYLVTPERIVPLNRAGLDYLRISIDNVNPDCTSKKSLKVLDWKLQWLAGHAEFAVTINSVLGSPVRDPRDAHVIARRARECGLTSTVGILHDGDGDLPPLAADHLAIYQDLLEPDEKMFAFAQYDRFHGTSPKVCRIAGIAAEEAAFSISVRRDWFITVPSSAAAPVYRLSAIPVPISSGKRRSKKSCAPFCTISCVHQTAMLDSFRENPRQVLAQTVAARRERNPAYRPPVLLDALTWMFVDGPLQQVLSKAALRFLKARS